ncbi:MAG: ARMT1-like domain-containing protein [Treponema sp.]|nr:ARMT1-like domain-containing protein [Treponema sp.]
MKACLDCLPCLARNAIDLAKKTAVDPARQLEIAKASIVELSSSDLTLPPPCYARRMIDRTLMMSDGVTPDPYKPEKDRSTRLALDLLKRLEEIPGWDPNDFESRLRLAVSGNVLDFQIYADLRLEDALKVMEEAFVKPVDSAVVAEHKHRMDAAKRILWIFDNCGEIVFDRLFMEPYREKITLAVRGRPSFNDATRAELSESGYWDGFAGGGVIDNATGIPGVMLDEAGDEMRKAFAAADLIICKGQGNFETMNELKGYPIAFLFLAKCPVVIRTIGATPRSIQVILRG